MTTTRAKILIVDDDITSVRMLDAILRDKYDLIVALNGEQALRRAMLAPPDIIILDIGLGDMDGYQVFQYLSGNEVTRDIPVIFVTAATGEAEEKKGLELGAVDYIVKPYRPAIILARINNYLELKHQRDQLHYLSSQDSLTGIANKRGFELFFEQAWQSAVRFDEKIALVYMDIDHFKKYNDNYGHIAGNRCLKKVAHVLTDCLKRKTDLVARYRDDEFVCVLSKTDLDGALHVAKKIQAAVIAKAISHLHAPTHDHITLSFGVAAVNPVWEQGDASVLLDVAVRLMYQAKAQDGNQICPQDGA
ncbi:MAG: diguanylate cyclase [Methylovulum sp.]|nr:diguanylate cyclase [Methylovulum sp.]